MQDKSPYMIIGLGNPERAYEKTRHNAGFRVVDSLIKQLGLKFRKKWGFSFYFCKGTINEKDFIAIKPRTYMNNSGVAVYSAVKRFNIEIQKLIIVLDDVWLPIGTIRIRKKGGAGGHNGLASIIEKLGTESIARLRIGIGGAEKDNLVEYVLKEFTDEEENIIKKTLPDAVSALIKIISNGIDAAMEIYNSKNRYCEKNEKDNKNFS